MSKNKYPVKQDKTVRFFQSQLDYVEKTQKKKFQEDFSSTVRLIIEEHKSQNS